MGVPAACSMAIEGPSDLSVGLLCGVVCDWLGWGGGGVSDRLRVFGAGGVGV